MFIQSLPLPTIGGFNPAAPRIRHFSTSTSVSPVSKWPASFVFPLPSVDSRRVEQVLPAEVEGAIPFDLDEVVWDHAVLSQGDGKTEVLVAVVKKTALRS